ncbi:hypothetical protein ASG12_02500 [Williamsia sp. Leaf354]|uniref:hypothetical protein n=1 Tax=Williamsia sp. Leaf354 TaxID=1736349 RepID=UPI0006F89A55|nr:hypothetical protein [Williamsia sp. Leaf354]KQR99682.1 hypothetical protein ASG12_02500 [Williamsia sp. Leaf354]
MRTRRIALAAAAAAALSVAAAPGAGAAPEASPELTGAPDVTISRPQVSTDPATRGEISVVISNVGTARATGIVAYINSFPNRFGGTELIDGIDPGKSVRQRVGTIGSTPFTGIVASAVYANGRDPQPLNNYSFSVEVLRPPR